MGHLERLADIAYDLREHKPTSKGHVILSIDSLLKKLVGQVKGATGAIILEEDGEAVRWYADFDGDRLRLRGAYVAVVLKASRAAASRAKLGDIRSLLLEYDRSRLVVQEIDRDCFVVLELGLSANIGQALFRLKPAVVELRGEIAP